MLLKFYLPNEDSGGEKIMTSHENQELPCWCFALVLPYNSVGVIFSPKMIIITNKQTKSLIFRVGIWWVVTITSQSIICLFVYCLSQRLRSSQSWRNPEKSKRQWWKREVKEKKLLKSLEATRKTCSWSPTQWKGTNMILFTGNVCWRFWN